MNYNFTTRFIKKLANLQFAIILLFTIGITIAIGTIIEQDQAIAFYKENYPIDNPLFGFLTWKVITFLNLDHLYTAWWFLLLLFLFSASLIACTFTTQLPSIKTFKIWKFYTQSRQFKNLIVNSEFQLEVSNTFVYNCNDKKYHFFRQRKKGYAYSGLLGRVGPIIVHASIVILLLGSTLGSFGGYAAQELIPRGEISHIQNVTKFGDLSYLPQNVSCRINDFWITYTKELKTEQFYSDLSLLDSNGKELIRKTIFVNEPLTFKDIVLYQTDWDIIGLKLRLPDNEVFQVPLKKIVKEGRKFWLGSITLGQNSSEKITILVNDLNGKLLIYDTKGVFIEDTFIGDSINLNQDLKVQTLEYITSTGLQIKSDPGISTVYFSFFLLMVSIYVSFFTYSQIWLIEESNIVMVGGKSNRAVLFFQEEFRKILKRTSAL
jgi:cytochrome c biogenesis protein